MNKGRRHQLKMLKLKKRLQNYGAKPGDTGNFHAFRTTGKPCSCHLCSPYRYAKGIKKEEYGAKRFEIAQSGI
jgi:hypothetical protein